MKRYALLGMVLLVFAQCQDVIEVDAPSEPPRLSVDALIRIDENAPTTDVIIKANLTSSFFGNPQTADLDEIIIRNRDYQSNGTSDQNFMVLTETAAGRYEASRETSFFTDGILELTITYGSASYLATTRYVPTVPIEKLEQGEGELFTGDETEILISIRDNPERNDFYLFDFDFNEYLVTEDEFYQGQVFEFSYFYDENVAPGREIDISVLGVDEPFYNYMNQLIVQSGGDQGPFQTPAATVRGNIINVTNVDNMDGLDNPDDHNNFALGYFAVCQVFSQSIVIE